MHEKDLDHAPRIGRLDQGSIAWSTVTADFGYIPVTGTDSWNYDAQGAGLTWTNGHMYNLNSSALDAAVNTETAVFSVPFSPVFILYIL